MSAPRKFDHDEARVRYAAGESQSALAREFGVHVTAVSRAVNPEVRARMAAASKEWVRAARRPCLGGCGQLVWTHMRGRTGYCMTCLGVLRRTAAHGTESRSKRCRCDLCRAAAAKARRERRHANIEAERAYAREYKRRRKAAA